MNETLPTSSADIIDPFVERQAEEGEQSVGEFRDGVQEQSDGMMEQMRQQQFLEEQMMREIQEAARAFHHEIGERFEADDQLGEIAETDGAAGMVTMGTREATFDFNAMLERSPEDQNYWDGVVAHERVHQEEQAAEYNLGALTFENQTIQVVPDLVEWHAIRKAEQPQPDSDLTPEYQEFARRGDELVAFLGSEELLIQAMHSGDTLSLQQEIDRREIEAIYTQLGRLPQAEPLRAAA